MKRAVRPSSGVLLTAFLVLVAGPGCKPNTRDNPKGCMLYTGDPPCPNGQHCDSAKYMCVADDAGAAGQGGGGGDGAEAGTNGSAGGAGGGADASGGTTGVGGMTADGGVDAPSNHCQATIDCAAKTGTTACDLTSSTCVECVDDGTCSGAKPACDTAKSACVQCTSTNATACTGTKVCDSAQHLCFECVGDGDCKTPDKSFCSKNVCVGCTDGNECKARDMSKPICGASGACVACDADKDCGGTTPFCGPQKACVSCKQAPQNATCAGLNSATPVCGASGACVQCGSDMNCSASPTTPFCSDAGSCVSCGSPLATKTCMVLTPTKPQCSSTGACVECLANNDCPDAKPVCSSSNSCGICTADADCANRGPAVCMSHLDGRCASAKETIYVQNNATCADGTGTSAGSATVPLCSMQPATSLVSATRDLVVVRGTVSGATGAFSSSVSIVGQSGTIAGTVNPALHISGGTTYARDVKLSTFDSIGLQADNGSTVRLDHVLVTGNAGQASDAKGGGILLDGASFDIRNTTVTNNGPGSFSGGLWGGILVNSPPQSGPKSLQLVTVQGNNPTGISCTSTISGTGVSVTGNSSLDIVLGCGITACGTASTTCGAQP